MATSSPIKILLWAPYGAGLHYDGAGMNAYRLYSELDPSLFSVDLAHGNPSQKEYALFNAQYFIGDIKVLPPLNQVLFLAKAKRWICRNIHQYDLIHGLSAFHHTLLPAKWAEQAGCVAVIKVANHRGGLGDHTGFKRVLGLPKQRREIIKKLSAIVAISSHIQEELIGYGIEHHKIHSVPNGVDSATFHPVGPVEKGQHREKVGLKDRFTILFVGEVVPRKQPDLLIRSLQYLSEANLDCQLVLVGPQKDRTYSEGLHELVASLQLEGKVIFREFSPDVADYYKASDVFALPSQNEGMSNALLEAMSSGLPSIVTPVSGSVDLISHGGEGFHAEGAACAIAPLVEQYILDHDLRVAHGDNARRKIMSMYTLEAVASEYGRLFTHLSSSLCVRHSADRNSVSTLGGNLGAG